MDNEVVKEGKAKLGAQQSYTPSDSDDKPSSGAHTYKVEFTIGTWTQSCTATFTVEDKTKQVPTISSCSVSDNGKFSAVVSNPDDVNYTYSFTIMDYIGNKLVDGTTGTGNETSLEYTYAPGKAGTYSYTVKIGESSCTKQRTVSSPIELKCQDITEQNASDMITVNPTVNNCSGCTYKIFDGDLEKSSDLTFSDPNATGTKQYRLQATDVNDNVASCNFNVSFSSESNQTTTLVRSDNPSWVYFAEGSHKVKCSGNQYSGHLVCKCPNTAWNYYDCRMRYNGTEIKVSANQSSGMSVDGSNTQCYNGYVASIEILSPYTTGNDNQKLTQGRGMYCAHTW